MSRFTDALSIANGLDSFERSRLISHLISSFDLRELEIVPVAWFARLAELAKSDPFAAGRLAAAMYAHLSAHRPESPAPLDAGFAPTEPERDPRLPAFDADIPWPSEAETAEINARNIAAAKSEP